MRRLLLGATLLYISSVCAYAETDHAAIARDAVANVIRPAYGELDETARTLKTAVEELCAQPSDQTLMAAKDAFAAAVASWSRAEIFQFGPINRDHRYERLFFWPDRKGLGARQVQRALAENDESVTAQATLAAKSVALQGLPALEFLLYAEGADGLAVPGGDGAFRCRFARAIAANAATIASNVRAAWAPDAAFTAAFLNPGANDPLYRAPKDVTLELFKAFSGGIERVRDLKLGKSLGESLETARPRLAAFWRSGLAFPNMTGNLEAVRALFADAGFAQIVAGQSAGVERSVLFDLDRSIDTLEAEKVPIAEAVSDPVQRAKLEALRVGLKSARGTASELIAAGAGLSFGFNASDGD